MAIAITHLHCEDMKVTLFSVVKSNTGNHQLSNDSNFVHAIKIEDTLYILVDGLKHCEDTEIPDCRAIVGEKNIGKEVQVKGMQITITGMMVSISIAPEEYKPTPYRVTDARWLLSIMNAATPPPQTILSRLKSYLQKRGIDNK